MALQLGIWEQGSPRRKRSLLVGCYGLPLQCYRKCCVDGLVPSLGILRSSEAFKKWVLWETWVTWAAPKRGDWKSWSFLFCFILAMKCMSSLLCAIHMMCSLVIGPETMNLPNHTPKPQNLWAKIKLGLDFSEVLITEQHDKRKHLATVHPSSSGAKG